MEYQAQSLENSNRAYWTRRAPGYSLVNQEELSGFHHEAWRLLLTERIAACLGERAPQQIRVLEVGTGPGFFAILLAEAGYRVTAVDYTPRMLEEAKNNAGPLAERIEFLEMDAQALRFEAQSFDVVLSRNLSWNLPRPEQAYAQWARVLRSGGLLLNFDANWYRHLFDETAQTAYEQDRENTRKAGLRDDNEGEGFEKMDEIARTLPLSSVLRPKWDETVLRALGMRVQTDTHIWQRVWSRQEQVNFASTPMFMIEAIKE